MPKYVFEKKNILVTGGAGFIGSHLCNQLLREGNRVICVDNLTTGGAKNIEVLLQNSDFRFLRLDVNEPFALDSYAELSAFKIPFQGIQEIYHLACPTSIRNFDQFKIQTLLSNSFCNRYVLDLALKFRAKILFASSSVVYGQRKDSKHLVSESEIGAVDNLSARACYDEGKRFSETMFETYRQVHGLDARIARIFRTYGPRMPLSDGQLIPDFVMSALDNKDLVMYGGRGFRTSLVYVTDVVDALLRLMATSDYQGPVNIRSDVDLALEDVANQIIKIAGSTSKIVEEKGFVFLSELALPSIERAKDLGWFPLVRLEDGLSRTIDYMRANKILLSVI